MVESTKPSINAFRACEQVRTKHIHFIGGMPVINQYGHGGLQKSGLFEANSLTLEQIDRIKEQMQASYLHLFACF